ncbi:hypothetical protein ABB37_01275 [Leptomonas pyrrhocoris]|uniref:Uncharacterized protein n=1 Tax=Leptomonas pyrrhocoris TaxID=157538 RepID=A0A0M9G8G0_LEPPY|nr:hypothetical protein ABB37_01275 [Leptomonas pyrrhocoris]KPA84793.1 hypothetical protein ABB37_01275 [Leptomonas pyrrhocoris]|eukprot:XP_015663232.1 hypothetical protein ABB37_01275 [Leptomonas pyrrhocoris]
MQVNVKAVSDALDGLLAEKELNSGALRQWQNPAIIQKRQPPPSQQAVSDSRTNGNPQTLLPHSSAKITKLESTDKKTEGEVKNDAPKYFKKPETPQRNASLHSPPVHNDEADVALNSAAAKMKRPSSRTSRSQKRGSSQKDRGFSFAGSTDVQKVFRQLCSAEIIAIKSVEASGLGVGSVLVTPHNVGKRIEKAQLPSKSWVTNTALTPSACAVLEVENFDQTLQEHIRSSPPLQDTKGYPTRNSTMIYRDVKVVLYVEDNMELFRGGGNDTRSQSPSTPLPYCVTVETSNSQHRGFISIGDQLLSPNNFVSFCVPGTLLNAFIRVTVKPSEQQRPAAKLIRVRTLCICWGDTWTSKTLEPGQPSNSLEEEVESVLREYSRKSESLSSTERVKDVPSPSHLEQSAQQQGDSLPEKRQQNISRDNSAKPAPMESSEIIRVADFVKNVALSNLQSGAASARKKEEDDLFHGTCAYNWFSDQVELCQREKSFFSPANHAKKTGGDEGETSASTASALSEYIETLQAWNNVPLWDVAEAVEFCLSQTTSFSASTISSVELFSGLAAFHLAQPFKVHFLFTASHEAHEESGKSAVPLGATPPPLHCLSSIASQAASLGFTSELLFKSNIFGSFGCVLRPENAGVNSTEDRCKLIFVIPSTRQSASLADTAEVVTFVLQAALRIFRKSESASQQSGKQLPGRLSPFVSKAGLARSPYGVLRMFVDGTDCFEKLTSILAEWSDVAGPVRYYGDASQPLLKMLLTPFQFAGLGSTASSEEKREDYNADVQWSRLHIKLIGSWKDSFNARQEVEKKTVALELQADASATFVWQSKSRGSTSLRLLLTDSHLLEGVYAVDGLILPSLVTNLVSKYADTPPVAVLCEAPWRELLQSAEKLINIGSTVSSTVARDSFTAFVALRRRVTISFAFHILSTAFKRGWERVGVSIPELCARFLPSAAAWANTKVTTARNTMSVDCLSRTSFSLLDEEAFMDTLVQWSYAFPRVVMMHCTSVFGSAAPLPTNNNAEISSTQVLSRNDSGVASLFSRETLCKFSSVQSLEEALA